MMLSQHNPPQLQLETKPFANNVAINKDNIDQDLHKLTCCAECGSHFEKEAQLFKSGQQKLPAWLQPQGTQARQKVLSFFPFISHTQHNYVIQLVNIKMVICHKFFRTNWMS